MRRILGSNNFPPETPRPIVALGNFDGVHIGHRRIIERVLADAEDIRGTSVVYTFEPHPALILAPGQCPRLLQTLDQKLACLEECGVSICVIEPFTKEFAHTNAPAFFDEVLVNRLKATKLVAGYDFTFGLHREGSMETLSLLCADRGVGISVVEPQFYGETLISSTNIRHLISRGDVASAGMLLGRPYSMEGKVVKGQDIGRDLNAHTANIESANELSPRDGVYTSRTRIQGEARPLPSVTSIGNNPTFPGSRHTIETHIIDRNLDIMGQRITIDFLDWMRDQITFESVEKLRGQIARDIDGARRYHEGASCHRHRGEN